MVEPAPIPAEALYGVRRGDPGAMADLCARRGGAVLGFCEAICGAALAPRAAAEAFARFRAAVAAGSDEDPRSAEGLLLGATRHAAASLAPVEPPSGGLLGRGRRRGGEVHAVVPTLLAARAEGGLGQADQDRLARHLERCETCRDVQERFAEAEERFQGAGEDPLPPELVGALVTSMLSAAPSQAVLTAPRAEPAAAEQPELATLDADPEPAPEPDEEEWTGEHELVALDEREGDVDSDPDEGGAAVTPVGVVAVDPDPELDGILDERDVLSDPDVDDDPGERGAPIAIRGRPEATAPATASMGGRFGRPLALLLPLAVVLLGALAAMAVAGVFGGEDPQPARSEVDAPPAQDVRPPVTTPLGLTGVAEARRARARERSSRRKKAARTTTAPTPAASSQPRSTTTTFTTPTTPSAPEQQQPATPQAASPTPSSPAPKKQSATKVPSGGGGASDPDPAGGPTPTFEPAAPAP